jgi:Rrf2 family iron-sulfur cluster assembly transcriptional regulator
MRVTTKGRYALRAILNLARSYQNRPIPIKQIAEEEDISPEFLEQIFFRLKKAGIIASVRGPGGGFILKQKLDEVSVKDLFEAVGEGLAITPCTACYGDEESGQECERQPDCAAYMVWKDASEHIVDYFENLKLKNIVTRKEEKLYSKLTEGQNFTI